jgi:hypothetical protein
MRGPVFFRTKEIFMPPRRTALLAALTTLTALVLAAPAPAATPIAPDGSPVTVTTTSSGQNVTLTFSGTAGMRVSLEMTNVTMGTSSCCGTKVSLLKPDGTALVKPTYVGRLGGFFEPRVLPANGTYKIFVDPQGTATGSMTLKLYDVPANVGGSLPFGGVATTVTLGTPGQNARLSFTGTAGQRVSVDLTVVTMDAKVSVLKPDGTALAAALPVGSSGGFLGPYKLPVNGTYKVFVNPTRASTGSMTLALYDVPPDVTTALSPGGPPETISLGTPGQAARLPFTGTAGAHISVKVSGVTIGASSCCGAKLSLVKPDGTKLVPATYFGTNGFFLDTKVLPVAGTYKLVLDPQLAATGNATVQLYSVPADLAGSLTIGGASVTATFSVPGQNGRYTFAGTAGKSLTVAISGVTMTASTRVTVRKPDGSALFAGFVSSDRTLTMTLPVAGTYSLSLDPSGAATGSITLALS